MAPAVSPDHRRARGIERASRRAPSEKNMNRINPIMSWRHRITALVVDGGTFFRTFQRSLLTAYGVQTEAVATGDAAAELIFGGRAFDLIVIDASLQGAFEATRQLRSTGPRSVTVVITTMHTEGEKASFLDAGADDYIEKPFTPDKFIPILAEIDNQR